jgi:hypothetical protein
MTTERWMQAPGSAPPAAEAWAGGGGTGGAAGTQGAPAGSCGTCAAPWELWMVANAWIPCSPSGAAVGEPGGGGRREAAGWKIARPRAHLVPAQSALGFPL